MKKFIVLLGLILLSVNCCFANSLEYKLELGKLKNAKSAKTKVIDIQINSEDLETGYKKSGIYRIYNQNNRIIYIGKSTSDLAERLRTSIREQFQKGNSMPYFYDYAIIDNKSDVDIFEVYYISLFKPCNNSVNIYTDMPSIVLPELNFTDLKEIKYTKEKEGL